MGLGRGTRRVAVEEAPKLGLVLGPGRAREVQKHPERHHHATLRRLTAMDVPHRIIHLLLHRLQREGVQLLVIFVHRARDHIPRHALRRLRLLVHKVGKRFRGRIGQPLVNRQAIALRLRNFLPFRIEEQLVGEVVRLLAAKDLADAVIDRRIGGMVLAIHLEVHIQRRPARAEVGLPLQFHVPARHGQGPFAARLVVEGDRAILGVHLLHWHVKHAAGFGMDRQEAGIGLLALFAQARQHHFHDRVVFLGRAQKRLVETARFVELGRRDELVFETEGVEEAAQHRVVMATEAVEFAERVRHGGQRLLQIRVEKLLLRHVLRHFPHPVHIVREADEPRRDIRDHLERAADHRRARHLAKGADMRQARGAITGLKQHIALLGRRFFITFRQRTGLFKGPSLGFQGCVAQARHDGLRSEIDRPASHPMCRPDAASY